MPVTKYTDIYSLQISAFHMQESCFVFLFNVVNLDYPVNDKLWPMILFLTFNDKSLACRTCNFYKYEPCTCIWLIMLFIK